MVTSLTSVGGHDRSAVLVFSSDDSYIGVIESITAPFAEAFDLAVTATDAIITDPSQGKVFVYSDSTGTWTLVDSFTTEVTGETGSAPSGVAIDKNGKILVSDTIQDTVKRFELSGSFIGYFITGPGDFTLPADVFTDTLGFVYVVDKGSNKVIKYESDGSSIIAFGTPGSGDGEFTSPGYVFENAFGRIFITDSGNDRVQLWECTASLCDYVNLHLDVGEDNVTPWEWSILSNFSHHERIWLPPDEALAKLNGILRRGCVSSECPTCTVNGSDCIIPFVFRSRDPPSNPINLTGGNLSIDDIDFNYSLIYTIAEVPYADRFRFSEGGWWTVQYQCNYTAYGGTPLNVTYPIPADGSCSSICNTILYDPTSPPSGDDEHDAIDDAMYRLLFEKIDEAPQDGVITKVDANGDGIPETCFDPELMWFDAKDEIGIQSLWGPTTSKLVVWTE